MAISASLNSFESAKFKNVKGAANSLFLIILSTLQLGESAIAIIALEIEIYTKLSESPPAHFSRSLFPFLYSDDEAFGEALYRCSYLAKSQGKGYGSLGANNYSVSRVQAKGPFNI